MIEQTLDGLMAIKVLEAVRKIATEDLSLVANKIDQEGFYPSEIMRDLAAAGAFCNIG